MEAQPTTDRQWKWRRIAYYFALFVWFCPIAFYFVPNRMMFGKWTWLTPADFADRTQRDCVPVVRAMKEYARDQGKLPDRIETLVPKYLPEKHPAATVWDGTFECWAMYNHRITYDFDPKNEGFYVSGAYTSGKIPLPPVQIEPAPTTHPE